MKMRYLKNVSTLAIDPDLCTGCGVCTNVCPHRVLSLEQKKAVIQERDACMECGACSMNCPTRAVTVQKGVGCAYAIIMGMIKGTAPQCDCGCGGESTGNSGCC